MQDFRLRRSIAVEKPDGGRQTVETLAEATAWLDGQEAGRVSQRTRRLLQEARSEGSLRKLRAATRAFEEAAESLGRLAED